MTTERQCYLAYMLRLWLVSNDGEPIWRASLESPHTGERLGFGSLEELFDSLRAHVVVQPKTSGKQHEARKDGLGNHGDLPTSV
jgi:hypothetical protein